MTGSLQGFLEEPLGGSRVSLSGKPEVDRGAGRINGTIQIPPVPTLANVRFVDPPGAVGWLVSVRAGISCSVRVRNAAPSAKRWCGQQGDLVLRAIPRRPDTKARTADTNGPRKQ